MNIIERLAKCIHDCKELERSLMDINETLASIMDSFNGALKNIDPHSSTPAELHDPSQCHYFTTFWGLPRCTGTKELDYCEGEDCERWKAKGEL